MCSSDLATGSHDEVVKIYRDLLAREDISPHHAAVVANNLAFQLAEPETAEEAGKLVEDALAELGPHPDVLDTRGTVMLAAGRPQEAVADLEEAVLAPTAAKYLHLASALARQQQRDKARSALAKAKEIGFTPGQLAEGDRRRLTQLDEILAE